MLLGRERLEEGREGTENPEPDQEHERPYG
ncbi:MAG: hypothetical protein K0R41_291, partial [Geminicoccaceae bacterium]|nr:hypothetical protein [Geminicoccaceae bacterium]MCE3246466.1 hypothetical protein [Geminicoccaceae bacterium]